MEAMREKLAVGLAEAARIVGVSASTIRREIDRDAIKATKVRRRLVIPISELQKLIGVEQRPA